MNHVKGICGHPVLAVGAPGSVARKAAELSLCYRCQEAERVKANVNAAVDGIAMLVSLASFVGAILGGF